MRKKSISLIIALTFLLSLFPMALPAFAADYTRLGTINSVDDSTDQTLNTVKVETSAGELESGDSVIVSLPSDFDFNNAAWTYGTVDGNVYYGDYSSGCYIYVPWADDNGLNMAAGPVATNIFTVNKLDDNEISITMRADASATEDGQFFVYMKKADVDEGFDGDINLNFNAPTGSGFDDADVVVGRVTGGDVTAEVTDDSTFSSDGGPVTIRIEEDRAGAFEVDPESVKFVLPDGFTWAEDANVDGNPGDESIDGADLDDAPVASDVVNTIFGAGLDGTIEVDGDELQVNITDASTSATCIEINAYINVDDETDAKVGDIVAKVKGESSVTPSELTVGTYGDFSVTATAKDPETVYAGQLEQAIADFTVKEDIEGSLVNGRSITLTLPEWAKWGALPDSIDDGSVTLTLSSFPGKDGTVAKYTISNAAANDAAELDFEDMEISLSPDAPVGDLEVGLGGTAAIDTTVKVAAVKKLVDVAVENSPKITIGKAGQPIGKITITEADGGLIKDGKDLTVELPKDVEWDDYTVEVTSGDLEIGDVDDADNLLTIPIDDASNDASTITITGTVTAYRTVPEGQVTAKVGGFAVTEVNDDAAVIAYYDHVVNDLELADNNGIVAIEDYEDDDALWEDADTVAEVEAAYVGTPAPSEEQLVAIFTLGSTGYSINGEAQTMDVAPYAKNGRTYVPMRYVAKALGIKDSGILWKNGTATFISGNKVVSVKVGSATMTINGAAVTMDVAPEIVSGRVMIPIKWIATAFDADVSYDAGAQTITIK